MAPDISAFWLQHSQAQDGWKAESKMERKGRRWKRSFEGRRHRRMAGDTEGLSSGSLPTQWMWLGRVSVGISWSHCDSLSPMRLCYCSVVDAGWSVPFFPFSTSSLSPPSLIHLSFSLFFKEAKMNTGASFHYLISLLLVHHFINPFLTPRNLYTFFQFFQLEDFIGVAQYTSPPFCIFAIYAQCSRLTEYL